MLEKSGVSYDTYILRNMNTPRDFHYPYNLYIELGYDETQNFEKENNFKIAVYYDFRINRFSLIEVDPQNQESEPLAHQFVSFLNEMAEKLGNQIS